MSGQGPTPPRRGPRRWLPRLRRRRRLRQLRQLRYGLASPRTTVFRWLRAGNGQGVALGHQRYGIDRQQAGQVVLGAGVQVGDYVDVHLGPDGRLEVAEGVVLGNHVQIAADRLVRIGAGARLGDYSVITDTWTYGVRPAGVPVPAPEPVVLGADVVLGARAVLGPGTTVPTGGRVGVGALIVGGRGVDAQEQAR